MLHDDWWIDTSAGRLRVLRGYITDGASIPRVFWITTGFPVDPDLLPAALAHDCLYGGEMVPRKQADDIFHELLRTNGVGRYRAWKCWLAVRLFGGAVWARHTFESIAFTRAYASFVDR
jgi:hypothetical protein